MNRREVINYMGLGLTTLPLVAARFPNELISNKDRPKVLGLKMKIIGSNSGKRIMIFLTVSSIWKTDTLEFSRSR